MVGGQFGKRKIAAIIQARYGSSRLPGKVLMNLPFSSDDTVLSQNVTRLSKVKALDEIIVATSVNESDNIIYNYCVKNNIICERGNENDVLNRFLYVAEKRNIDVIVRITCDNPIILIDKLEDVIDQHIKNNADYTRNLNLPYGTSFEIMNFETLKLVYQSPDLSESDKEHVTPFIKRHNEKFHIQEINHNLDFNFRFTIDYPSDYAVMNIIFQYLKELNYVYDIHTLIHFIKNNKWLETINGQGIQKKQFDTTAEEINSAIKLLEQLEYKTPAEILKNNLR